LVLRCIPVSALKEPQDAGSGPVKLLSESDMTSTARQAAPKSGLSVPVSLL
jgi:hypothetical protein